MKKLYLMRGMNDISRNEHARYIRLDWIFRDFSVGICSIDDFFSGDGEYNYDYTKLDEARLWCELMAMKLMAIDKCNIVIVNNANVQAWEMLVYVQAAMELGYEIKIIEPTRENEIEAEESAHRDLQFSNLWEPNVTIEQILASKNETPVLTV